MLSSKILFISVLSLIILSPYASVSKFTESTGTASTSSTFPIHIATYTPTFDALNIKEQMTLSPLFTPDNAIDIYVDWITRANTTIEIQNPYITQWGTSDWASDPNPIMIALVAASNRGVTIQFQMNEDVGTEIVASYLESHGIAVRYMGNSTSTSDNSYLSNTHNKIMIIDDEVGIVSSINFSANAFTNNREAGMVIQDSTVALYYKQIFVEDWNDGEIPSLTPLQNYNFGITTPSSTYTSHTNIPKTNFTGTYNVTAFTNPDNADGVIFKYLQAAKQSIYVSMYTISRPDFNNTLIALKNANPSIDIQVLISDRRVGASENVATKAAAESLVANGIQVYNSSTQDGTVNGFYHNKYWIIDGKNTFVYSGNWSPASVTPPETSYASGGQNRDMGIAVLDAPDIAAFYKSVWDQDIAVGSAWQLPNGIRQTSFQEADVVSGTITLSAAVDKLPGATVSYQWGNQAEISVSGDTGFSQSFDTTTIPNGITTFTVKAVVNSTTYTDSVKVNIVNYADFENFRFLITEVMPNPSAVSDAEGEFMEITNSFPFALLISDWQVGDNNLLYTFTPGYTIDAYTSLIIARSKTGFDSAYGVTADIELGFSLANTQDYVALLNAHSEYVDVVAYGMAAPDNSEQLKAPDAGQSIQRSPLTLDTNKASDFIYGDPTPKADVPHATLALPGASQSTSNTPILGILVAMSSILCIISIRKRWKKQY